MCWENHFRVLILLVLGRRKKMLINVNLLAIILLLQQSGKMRRRSSVYKLFFFFSITEYISVFFDIIIQQWLLADWQLQIRGKVIKGIIWGNCPPGSWSYLNTLAWPPVSFVSKTRPRWCCLWSSPPLPPLCAPSSSSPWWWSWPTSALAWPSPWTPPPAWPSDCWFVCKGYVVIVLKFTVGIVQTNKLIFLYKWKTTSIFTNGR